VRCVVPRVVGLRLAAAKRKLRQRSCGVGRIRRVHSRRVGRVIRQNPRAGAIRRVHFPVAIAVGRR
jgi:beta-lactam-binding protein with PASTA domain